MGENFGPGKIWLMASWGPIPIIYSRGTGLGNGGRQHVLILQLNLCLVVCFQTKVDSSKESI